MFSSPSAYVWFAWLLIVVAIAVLRFSAQRRRQRQKSETSDGPITDGGASSESNQTRNSASLKGRPRLPESADYREELIAAGIIHPATELITVDPATEA